MKSFVVLLCSLALASINFCLGQDLARMDQVVQSYVNKGEFMGSVLVARGDQVLFSKGYGSANLEWNIPDQPSTKFRLGSLTKQFTAASVLLLEERGKLKTDDLVKKYLPDAPAAWDKIAIFHLLTHTSGIPSFTSFPDYAASEPFATTPEKLVARFRDRPLEFEPGEKWNYSNSGYVLLGYLIEKISGESYAKFVQENIFTPLGMKDSGYDSNSAIIPRRAAGYELGPHGPENAGFVHMSGPFSAGALYSTTEDLLRWEQGLFGGKLLSAASLQKMTTPFKQDYAFGLGVTTRGGHKLISHNGGIEGFRTYLGYYPDDRVTVAVLGNVNDGAPGKIGAALGALVHGEPVKLPTESKVISLARATLQSYVGTYELQPGVQCVMTLEDDQLMMQLTGQPKIPLFAETETKFFLMVVNAQVDFSKNDHDEVTDFVLHQNGRDMKAQRISGTIKAPVERKAITVAPDVLQQYIGTYPLTPAFAITVTLENGQLMEQATHQPKFPIFPETKDKFFLKVVDAEIEFVRDASGTVKSLILHQGGYDQPAPKQ
jgi:CubicO group peptidase (beta-lactamase class C family)